MSHEETESLPGLLRKAFDNMLSEVYVGMPGKIESYDNTTGLANIKPLVSRRFRDHTFPTELPVLQGVPVIQPRTLKAQITLPITVGDGVFVFFADRSIETWKNGDGVLPREPGDVRMHDLSDGFAILGAIPPAKILPSANPDAVEILVKPGVKVAIGNGVVELLTLIEQLRAVTSTHFHIGFAGIPTAPPDAAALLILTDIQTKLATLLTDPV